MSLLDEPITRHEMYLSYLNGNTDIILPEPITRIERYLYALCMNGGGGAISGNIINIASTDIDGGTRVTFTYILEDGTQKTHSFDVMDGTAGEEKDPTVPDWAKQDSKPTYNAEDVGAVPAGNAMTYADIDEVFNMVFGGRA